MCVWPTDGHALLQQELRSHARRVARRPHICREHLPPERACPQALWLAHVKGTRAGILEEIMTKKQITPEIEAGLKSGMEEFLGMHEFEGRTA